MTMQYDTPAATTEQETPQESQGVRHKLCLTRLTVTAEQKTMAELRVAHYRYSQLRTLPVIKHAHFSGDHASRRVVSIIRSICDKTKEPEDQNWLSSVSEAWIEFDSITSRDVNIAEGIREIMVDYDDRSVAILTPITEEENRVRAGNNCVQTGHLYFVAEKQV